MSLPDVEERVQLYEKQNAIFTDMVKKYSAAYGNCLVTDLRDVNPIYTGNRFLPYSLYPEQNISLWVVDGRDKQNCPIAVGHSILNRTSRTKVGSLLLKYGGGGHDKVGTCQIAYADADRVIKELVAQINADG
jgi:nanoRNase/pAp phosphatase (c-di-AMP/oligoRNAs hydrolase)